MEKREKAVIAWNLRRLREQAEMTQALASDFIGVYQSRLSSWECGVTMPSIEMIARICRTYNCYPNDLWVPIGAMPGQLDLDDLASSY